MHARNPTLHRLLVVCLALFALLTPRLAHAQGFISPSFGYNIGGDVLTLNGAPTIAAVPAAAAPAVLSRRRRAGSGAAVGCTGSGVLSISSPPVEL